jgi:hypothetical protein
MQPKSKLFVPRHYEPPDHDQDKNPYSQIASNKTPPPSPVISSLPTWDPSSQTPMVIPEPNMEPIQHLVTQRSNIQHPLLDPQFVGKKLRVVVHGGSFKGKEITVAVALLDGWLSIRHNNYKTSESISPEWVFPKHPNPMCDNGLLIVIHGEHFGKYVRLIYHQYENDKPKIILAMINKVEDAVNRLAGEQFELDPDRICVSFKTKEEKQQNDMLMTTLREEAQKTWAK